MSFQLYCSKFWFLPWHLKTFFVIKWIKFTKILQHNWECLSLQSLLNCRSYAHFSGSGCLRLRAQCRAHCCSDITPATASTTSHDSAWWVSLLSEGRVSVMYHRLLRIKELQTHHLWFNHHHLILQLTTDWGSTWISWTEMLELIQITDACITHNCLFSRLVMITIYWTHVYNHYDGNMPLQKLEKWFNNDNAELQPMREQPVFWL